MSAEVIEAFFGIDDVFCGPITHEASDGEWETFDVIAQAGGLTAIHVSNDLCDVHDVSVVHADDDDVVRVVTDARAHGAMFHAETVNEGLSEGARSFMSFEDADFSDILSWVRESETAMNARVEEDVVRENLSRDEGECVCFFARDVWNGEF